MKPNRQNIILDIIANEKIETQNQLLNALKLRVVNSTQATLSRDINDLNLVKVSENKGEKSYYVVSDSTKSKDRNDRLHRIFKECLVSCDFARNMIVIKTLPGLANGACSALDGMEIDGLLGTLAGDDTAFIVMRDNETAKRFAKDIETNL